MYTFSKIRQMSLIAVAVLPLGALIANDSPNNALKGPWPLIGGKNQANLGINFKEHKLSPSTFPLEIAWMRTQTTTGGNAVQSQPVVVKHVLYAADAGGNVFAVNSDTSTLIWSTNIPNQIFQTSPSVIGDDVYVAYDTIYDLDRTTGAIKWSTLLYAPDNYQSDYSGNTVVVDDQVIVGVSSAVQEQQTGKVIAFNRHTGEKNWQFDTTTYPAAPYGPGQGVWVAPAVDIERGLVFVGSGEAYSGAASPFSDAIIALDLYTGELVWSYQFRFNDVWNPSLTPSLLPGTYDLDVSGHPILFSAKINGESVDLVGTSSKDGSYRIFMRDQKYPDYVQPLVYLQLDSAASVQGVSVRAIADGKVLYVTSTALLSKTGGRESLDYGLTDPALGTQYLTQKTSLKTLALNIKKLIKAGNTSGAIPKNAIIWESTTFPGFTMSNPLSYANGVLYQTSFTGFVRAIDAKTGAEIWKNTPMPLADPSIPFGPTFCTTGVTIAHGMIYIGLGFETGGSALPGGGVVAYQIPANLSSSLSK